MSAPHARTTGAVTLMLTAMLGGSVVTAPASVAEPNVEDVQQRVDKLYRDAQEASERYNQKRLELRRSKKRLQELQADLGALESRIDTARDVVAATVVTQYQGQAVTDTAQLMSAEDPDLFLGVLARTQELNAQQAFVVDRFGSRVEKLEARAEAAQRHRDRLAEARTALAEEKATIEDRAAEAEALLERLEEREQRASRSETRVPSDVPASGRAGAAVQYALAQVGDTYVYGAAGPDSFDCSGLTMRAWQAAGVSLPHSSQAQMSSGTRVSTDALKPGDLVFYYSPVSHVGIYIGDGMIVHAANPRTDVETAPLHSMPLTGAVRPG